MDEQKERAAFEAWISEFDGGSKFDRSDWGDYDDFDVQRAWAGWQARAALAAAPAPPEPMSVLTDKDIMKAAVSWREFDAPDECGPADRMVYGACRAVLAAYHAALQSKEQSNG